MGRLQLGGGQPRLEGSQLFPYSFPEASSCFPRLIAPHTSDEAPSVPTSMEWKERLWALESDRPWFKSQPLAVCDLGQVASSLGPVAVNDIRRPGFSLNPSHLLFLTAQQHRRPSVQRASPSQRDPNQLSLPPQIRAPTSVNGAPLVLWPKTQGAAQVWLFPLLLRSVRRQPHWLHWIQLLPATTTHLAGPSHHHLLSRQQKGL